MHGAETVLSLGDAQQETSLSVGLLKKIVTGKKEFIGRSYENCHFQHRNLALHLLLRRWQSNSTWNWFPVFSYERLFSFSYWWGILSVVLSNFKITFLGEGEDAAFYLFLHCILFIDSTALSKKYVIKFPRLPNFWRYFVEACSFLTFNFFFSAWILLQIFISSVPFLSFLTVFGFKLFDNIFSILNGDSLLRGISSADSITMKNWK